jgi:membrane protein implicated in regulation of membrane protease activity
MALVRFAPLMFVFSGLVFLWIGMFPEAAGKRNVTFLVLGVVFLMLAAARFVRTRSQTRHKTDPRLPARDTHHDRQR